MRFISLRTKLIAASLCFVLLPIIGIGAYAYNEFENILSAKIAEATSDRLLQVNRNIVQELTMMVNASRSIVLDENVLAVLAHSPETSRDKLDNVGRMDKKFLEVSTAILTSSPLFTLIDNDGFVYTNWGQTPQALAQLRQSDWYRQAEAEKGYMVWKLNHESYTRPAEGKLVTLAMAIRDKDLQNVIGMLIISRPADQFLRMLSGKSEGVIGFMVDEDGQLLGERTPELDALYPRIAAGLARHENGFTAGVGANRFEIVADTVPIADWRVVQAVSYNDMLKPVAQIRQVVFVLFAISMVLFMSIIVVLSSMVTRPLRQLGGLMKQVQSGKMDVVFEIRSRDEVGLLGRTFNQMLLKLRDHLDREIELERSKEQAKLEALQAQINPHFLHNTLNTIKWMSIMRGAKDITDMLLSLGNLLNMSINRGQEAIRLAEEIENVRSFLTIQKYRFGDTIRVVESFETETLDGYVPKLSLQPLVENVYRHGLFIGGGQMTLSSRLDGDELLLRVADNGAPPAPERLQAIEERLAADESGSFSGIGISNVHRRIQLMFGSAYGLRFERDEVEGTNVFTIHIPFRRDGV